MTGATGIIVFAVLFCAWSGTSAQETDNGSCEGYGFGAEQEQQWSECWPACGGDYQSPIDVQTNDSVIVELPPADGPFYQDRNIPFHFRLTNENYTVTLELLDGEHLYLEGGPLDGRYFLHHMQFCWGSDDSRGSDHTFNGKRFLLEGQWGLFSDKYETYEEASEHPGGVLRISQLYPLVDEENPSLAPIVRALPDVVQPGQTTTPDEPLQYDQLFSGYSVNDFYHYNGSFTSPPCSETVIWLVYPPLNGVTSEQVAAFRNLQSTDGPLVDNFRLPKPLNGRQVIRSDKSTGCLGSCDTPATPASRLSAKRHQASKTGKRHQAAKSAKHHQAAKSGRHSAARHRAAARHQ